MWGKIKMTKVEIDPNKFYEIGCRKCDCFPSKWIVLFNPQEKRLMIKCKNCGHVVDCDTKNVENKPDNVGIDARFFS